MRLTLFSIFSLACTARRDFEAVCTATKWIFPNLQKISKTRAGITNISQLFMIAEFFLLAEVNLQCLHIKSLFVNFYMAGMEIAYKFLVNQPLLYLHNCSLALFSWY